MTQSIPNDAGPRDGRSVKIAIIANTATGLMGKRENGTMHIDLGLDIHLGKSITRPSTSRQGQPGRVG
jgi:hypothetical protein